jgi:hypothetical protein
MGDIVNLRRARKRKARDDREAEASARRTEVGVSKTERRAASAERALLDRRLQGHKLGADAPEPAGDEP